MKNKTLDPGRGNVGSGNAVVVMRRTAATQEPKKWNLRRKRPMLDFTTMEELNEMDDYDSEDDNDWRPAAGKKKAKAAAAQRGGSEGEEEPEEEDGDGGSGSDDDDNEDDDGGDDEDENEEGSSSDSDKEVKKPKKKVISSSVFDKELTNDSLSQGKSNKVNTTFKSSITLCCWQTASHPQHLGVSCSRESC